MYFGKRPATVAKSPATVAKTAARVASAAATATANAKTPGAARAANNLAKKAAAVANAAAKKTASPAAKQAATKAANSAAKANTVMLGRGIRMTNVTNKVKMIASKAATLGGSAYATYLSSDNAQALMIAATCLVLLYIAYGLLGRTPKTRVSVLQGQINAANRNLARRTKAHPRHAVYKAYMRKGNVNAANRVMNAIRTNFAPNATRIAGMRAQLHGLLNEVTQALPLVAPSRNASSIVQAAVPYAKAAIEAYKEIKVLEIESMNAHTAHIAALTSAKTAQAKAKAQQAEQRVKNSVQPYTARVRGAMAAAANVATTATAVGTALAPVGRGLLSGAQGAARLYYRRRGVGPQ